MTESKAIKIIKEKACDSRCIPPLCNDGCMYENTKCAFSMAIQALEKQIAKKPKKNTNSNIYFCSVCERKVAHNHALYCSGCGQKLDWSEEE